MYPAKQSEVWSSPQILTSTCLESVAELNVHASGEQNIKPTYYTHQILQIYIHLSVKIFTKT